MTQAQPTSPTTFIAVLDDFGEAAFVIEGLRITAANDVFCRLTGRSPEDLLALASCLDLAPPDELPELHRRRLQRVANPSGITHVETRICRPDGEVRHVSVSVKPFDVELDRCVILVRDVTPQKRNEEDLRRANDQFAIILQGVADGIFATDAKGDLVYANDAALRFFGYTRAQAEHLQWRSHLARHVTYTDEEGRPLSLDRLPIMRALAGEVVPGQVLNYHFQETGERRSAVVKASPAFDAEGRVRYAIAILTDQTERLRLDRLKGDFLNAVTHELRTPLTSIKAYAEFLEDELSGPLSAEQHGFLAQLQKGADQLEVLVDDLLDFARIEAGEFAVRPQPCDGAAIVRQVADAFTPVAQGRELQLTVRVPSTPLPIKADPKRLVQILNNLMSNALKFTPAGGAVAIGVHPAEDAIAFEVSDSGIGIAREHMPHLFTKFFQAESSLTRSYQGTGLGLPITKALIEAHGGAISVTSEPGVGSTFTVRLPNP